MLKNTLKSIDFDYHWPSFIWKEEPCKNISTYYLKDQDPDYLYDYETYYYNKTAMLLDQYDYEPCFAFLDFMSIALVISYRLLPFVKLILTLLTNFFSFLVLIVILRRLKFQTQQPQQRSELINTLRIAIVLIIQSIFSSAIALFNFIDSLYDVIYDIEFLRALYNLAKYNETFVQIRILLDSLVVIFILTDYRKTLMLIIKRVFRLKMPQNHLTKVFIIQRP